MAAKPFNRGGLDEGLAEYLGLKGRLGASIESEIRPVVLVSDLSDGPYARDYSPVAGTTNTLPTAAQVGYAGVRPGVGACLQVSRIRIHNLEAGTITYVLHMLDASSLANIVTGGTLSVASIVALRYSMELAASPVGRGASQVLNLVSTISNTANEFDRFQIPGNTGLVIELPPPGVLLIRRTSAATGGLFVRPIGLDFDMQVTFYGKEWPLPG